MGIRTAIRVGEGLVGQCALDKRRMLITDLPANTVPVRSGIVRGDSAQRDRAAGAV